MPARVLLQSAAFLALADWATTLSLVFGGCCTNALSLEIITGQHPAAGSLITLAQFLLISLVGLRKHLAFGPPRPDPWTREQTLEKIADAIIALRAADVASAVHESRRTRKKAERTNLHYRIAVDYAGPHSDPARRACTAFADDLGERLRRESGLSGIIRSSVITAADGEDVQLSKSQWRPALSSQTRTRKHLDVDDLLTERRLDEQHSPLLVTIPDDSVLILDGQGVLGMPVPPHWWHLTVSLRDRSSKTALPENRSDASSLAFDVEDWAAFSLPRAPVRWPWTWMPRLKERRVPLKGYLIQVVLYYLVSILNNAAFAYNIPMAAHIIFRSGGLVMNMVMGRLFAKRRYTPMQVFSVLVVTVGVLLTTVASIQAKPPRRPTPQSSSFSASSPSGVHGESAPPLTSYLTGIGLLTLALVLASTLGLTQDTVLATYGRGNADESLFYLHALALPLFAFVAPDLRAQLTLANSGPTAELSVATLADAPRQMRAALGASLLAPPQPPTSGAPNPGPLPLLLARLPLPAIRIPSFYIPLLANILTQLVCTAGVHRLTARVGSLTVALVLAVRKAVSLAVSVRLLGGAEGDVWLWGGAAAVLLGTVGYVFSGAGEPAFSVQTQTQTQTQARGEAPGREGKKTKAE